jgi:uncharacterized DUF497 family protein
MATFVFEWDEAKNRANRSKHGVSFEEARTVLFDESARLIADPEHSDDESRFVLLRHSIRLRLLVVWHRYRASPDVVRILSARRAGPSGRREYARWLK